MQRLGALRYTKEIGNTLGDEMLVHEATCCRKDVTERDGASTSRKSLWILRRVLPTACSVVLSRNIIPKI